MFFFLVIPLIVRQQLRGDSKYGRRKRRLREEEGEEEEEEIECRRASVTERIVPPIHRIIDDGSAIQYFRDEFQRDIIRTLANKISTDIERRVEERGGEERRGCYNQHNQHKQMHGRENSRQEEDEDEEQFD